MSSLSRGHRQLRLIGYRTNGRRISKRFTGWQNLPFYPNSLVLKQALVPTLQEPGCEALFETSREGAPHKLVFFEIFSSSAAHRFHLEQDYTKRMFAALEGKLAAVPIMTELNAL